MPRRLSLVCPVAVVLAGVGCHQHPKLTARRVPTPGECVVAHGKGHEPDGIPFYLPKPLLVVAKNFRYVEEGKVGLYAGPPIPTGYDNQAAYATLNASATVNLSGAKDTLQAQQLNPGVSAVATAGAAGPEVYTAAGPNVTFKKDQVPADGLTPHVFYTYQIVFVPDLTQKYALEFKGGAGEMRAALQLVNGWQFTGLGPFYLKDSSTAQNHMAFGIGANLFSRGVSDAVQTLVNLRGAAPGQKLTPQAAVELLNVMTNARTETYADVVPTKIANYAEIRVYEPYLAGGQMEWREIVCQSFDRDVTGQIKTSAPAVAANPAAKEVLQSLLQEPAAGPGMDPEVVRALTGVAPNARLQPQSAVTPTAPAAPAGGVVNQQNVTVHDGDRRGWGLPRLGLFGGKAEKRRPVTGSAVVDAEIGPPPAAPPAGPGPTVMGGPLPGTVVTPGLPGIPPMPPPTGRGD